MRLRRNTLRAQQQGDQSNNIQVSRTTENRQNQEPDVSSFMPLSATVPYNAIENNYDEQQDREARPFCQSPHSNGARKVLSTLLDSPRRVLRKSRNRGKRPCVRDLSDSRPLLQDQSSVIIPMLQDEPLIGQYGSETYAGMKSEISMPSSSLLSSKNTASASDASDHPESPARDFLSWMHDEAPTDIIPKILSFMGPQNIELLSRLNKSWRSMCLTDAVWKTLCEDYKKWIPGEDPVPFTIIEKNQADVDSFLQPKPPLSVWNQYYCDNPIVPLDFKTIESALLSISTISCTDGSNERDERSNSSDRRIKNYVQKRNARILLQPGRHITAQQLLIRAKGGAIVEFRTLMVSPVAVSTVDALAHSTSMIARNVSTSCSGQVSVDQVTSTTSSEVNAPPSPTRIRDTIRSFLTCRSAAGIIIETNVDAYNGGRADRYCLPPLHHGRATIVLHTNLMNEPVIRVQEGGFRIKQVDLVHSCQGTDIWNGNAALQVQPLIDHNHNPIRASYSDNAPTATIEEADIISFSGRGIVSIDGARSSIRNSFVHDCAATGIYIGGMGSSASIDQTDIFHNGFGNRRSRVGIGRGHSGVYLEQGEVSLTDCNISQNSLTGISAVSHNNASVVLKNSDLQGNGTLQLELPPTGTPSRGRCVTNNNSIATQGSGRRRSSVTPTNMYTASNLSSAESVSMRHLVGNLRSDNVPLLPTE